MNKTSIKRSGKSAALVDAKAGKMYALIGLLEHLKHRPLNVIKMSKCSLSMKSGVGKGQMLISNFYTRYISQRLLPLQTNFQFKQAPTHYRAGLLLL